MIRGCIAFVVWGILVLALGIPLLLVGTVHPSRRMLAWASHVWALGMLKVCGVSLTVEGADAVLDGYPRFFVGNHQSALDIPVLIAALRGDVRFMAKDSLFRIPVFGWVLSRYGFVPIDRNRARRAAGRLERMITALRERPISFAVFPEGTRSRDGALQPFRKGTMKICQRSGMPVVPFSIDGAMAVHHRDRLLRTTPGPVRLVFGKPIPAEEVAAISTTELFDRVRAAVAHQLGRDSLGAQAMPPAYMASESG